MLLKTPPPLKLKFLCQTVAVFHFPRKICYQTMGNISYRFKDTNGAIFVRGVKVSNSSAAIFF